MNLCRFRTGTASPPRPGLIRGGHAVLDLSVAGPSQLAAWLELEDLAERLGNLGSANLPCYDLAKIHLLSPVERQEVWAAGVTYLRSKTARMAESDFSANAYDRVYEAARPELFFKSLPDKVSGPGQPVGIRRDARWNVPEPELALVLNARGRLVGYTIGNDMSSRDLEGENLLYLPQAKIYRHSCALGPWIQVGASEAEAREWSVRLEIQRGGATVFAGETIIANIKRRFTELADYLFRCQDFPHGAVLLTGTGIVPPDTFTLQPGDEVRIQISGIGELVNEVVEVT